MDTPIVTPRLSLLVQSADPHPDAVVLEDLRTGRRERFESLEALANYWHQASAPSRCVCCGVADPPDPSTLSTHPTRSNQA